MKAIIELQKRAMDSSTDIVELVRYAYAIAYKLELQDFADWCSAELKGYSNDSKVIVPEYRRIRGEIVVIFAKSQQKQIHYTESKASDYMQQKLLLESLYVLEGKSKKDIVMIELDYERKRQVIDWCERDYNDFMSKALSGIKPENDPYNIKKMHINSMPSLKPYLSVNNSKILKIFGVVRQKILDWALECEKQDILGEGLEFTKEEKQMAQNITYNIGSVQNMANHNTDTTVNQMAQNMSVIKGDFNSLANFLSNKGVSEPDIRELKEIIDVESNLATEGMGNNKVQGWVGKIATKIATGTIAVAKGVTVEVIVKALEQFL